MRKERFLTPSQTARYIFRTYDNSAKERERIENAIETYSQMTHPHAKIIARRLAKKLYRAKDKEIRSLVWKIFHP